MSNITLKIEKNSDIRRVPVSTDLTFSGLKELVGELFQDNQQNLTLKYKDNENDWISVASDVELKEAFRFVSKDGVLKLVVVEKPSSKPKSAASNGAEWLENLFEQVLSPSTWSNFAQELQKEFKEENTTTNNNNNEKPQHNDDDAPAIHAAICDSCQDRIVGLRFKCTTCPDYDLCSICIEKKGIHPSDHAFDKITKPAFPFPGRWGRRAHPHPFGFPPAPSGCPQPQPGCPVPPFGCPPPHHPFGWRRNGGCRRFRPDFATEPAATATATTATEVPKAESPVQEPAVTSPVSEPVAVPEEKPVVVAEEKPKEKADNKFEAALKTLSEMGFADREKNIQVLIKNRGDLVRAVRDLLGN